ncbi:MAG: helix-turn-helix domain-containing protein [Candidatus Omnitrophica bacterium]|nr:helix-turn-helix domain-containing protein [Candidatus Omnitrophota bacterium]
MAYTIFIIDDDKAFCEEFSDAFYEYNVIKAFNAQDALDELRKPNEIDLIILDERLPNNKKGTLILEQLRKIMPSTPIVILTGFSSKETAIRALRAHADEYLEKPMDIPRTKQLIEDLLHESDKKNAREGSDIKSKIARVKIFIEKNFDKIVTLEDAAGRVGLSPKYLSRAFKEETGTNFNEYYLKCKFKKAEELLNQTSYTIEQIADKLGYKNPESFIRIYKKHWGSTPTQNRTSPKKKKKQRKPRAKKTSKKR